MREESDRSPVDVRANTCTERKTGEGGRLEGSMGWGEGQALEGGEEQVVSRCEGVKRLHKEANGKGGRFVNAKRMRSSTCMYACLSTTYGTRGHINSPQHTTYLTC